MFPLNAWYAATWDTEVGRTLLPRTIGGRPLVFYRTTSGRPAASTASASSGLSARKP